MGQLSAEEQQILQHAVLQSDVIANQAAQKFNEAA